VSNPLRSAEIPSLNSSLADLADLAHMEGCAMDNANLIHDLQNWCLLANAAAYDIEGVRNTCIHTSHALVAFLQLQGFEAEVFRARARVHPTKEFERRLGRRGHGACAGEGHFSRSPGGWAGHLAVSCGEFVLDPTLDQLEAEGQRPRPAVFAKPVGWDVPPSDRPWQGGAWHHWRDGDLDVSHARHPRQVGWKSKPAARPSSCMEVVDLMVSLFGKPADIEDRNVLAWMAAQEAATAKGGVR
jgi:hypothetical protein